MHRLLLPGMHIKRWILATFAGMLLFAVGFCLLLGGRLKILGYPSLTPEIMALLSLIGGVVLVGIGTQRLVQSFTRLANPDATNGQLMRALVEKRHPAITARVVGIGGGTGLSTLLRGLKAYPLDLSAIVAVSDDGGSSGRLVADLDIPPPGDIRACLVALAEAEPLMERIFQHRFSKESNDLNGHSLGNLIIAGLSEMTGDFKEAVHEVSRVLAVRGRVLPSADRPLMLKAVMTDGTVVEGERAITAHPGIISSIAVDPPEVTPLPEAIEALQQADVIVVGPGSVYTSILPNLVIPGMAQALVSSPAIKFFVCNVMTQPGETDDFNAASHLEAMLRHLPGKNPFHYVVINLQRPPQDVVALYAEEGQQLVDPALARVRTLGSIPVTGNLLAHTHLARHDPDKLARTILEQVALDTNSPKVLRRRR